MTSRLRQRVATAIVVCVMVWPLLHHGLTRSLEMDPWSFFGFAMYAVPNLRVTVRAAGLDAPDADPDWNAIPVAAYPLLREYGERRARFGRLLPPDDLAEALLERHPELPGVLVRIRRWEIDRASSRLVASDRDFRFQRAPAAP